MVDSFRIHPAIGIARVGNSEEYFIAPETMAGSPAPGAGPLTGGLPIRAGTESEPIRSGDVRDAAGALKRQAARFRVFAYPPVENETWPRGDGVEITGGSSVNGKTVKAIVWTVHLANKKANNFILAEEGVQGINGYRGGIFPPIRNPSITDPKAPQPSDDQKIAILSDPARVRQLTIDPGPRTIAGANSPPVAFDAATVASYFNAQAGQVAQLPNYPKGFPGDSFPDLYQPSGAIDTLGELVTDAEGRLLVLGGYGRAVGWPIGGNPPLPDDVNNNQWFDDASDGPVSAAILFDDNSVATAAGAWVTATDPSYAPQILNVVSLWDDMYDCWVRDRNFGLAPQIYDETNGGYQQSYKPTFDDQLSPIFQSARLQQWVVNLNQAGIGAHGAVGSIQSGDAASNTPLAGLGVFRYPNNPSDQDAYDPTGTPLMPFHLGDSDSFLTLRETQLFFLQRWNQGPGNYATGAAAFGPGEYLDKATLVNCLGGRFSPGIDLTFVMREPSIYTLPWQSSGGGPFRLTPKALAYATATTAAPLLGIGYVPQQNVSDELEPGDLSKFMALPWHTDYNSCATHPPSPNPPSNSAPGQVRLFWSWPAQRPVAVYTSEDARQAPAPAGASPGFAQRWSVRGPGTESPDGENWGRYQDRIDMLANWNNIGVIMQAPQIDPQPSTSPANWYLEVESKLGNTGDPVPPFPNFVGPNQGGG